MLTESLSSAQKIRNLYKLMSGDISVSQIPFKFQVCSRARTITATRLVVSQTLKVIPVRTQASATTPYLMKEVSIKPEYQEGQTKKGPQATGVKILDNRKVRFVILLQSRKSFCRNGPSTVRVSDMSATSLATWQVAPKNGWQPKTNLKRQLCLSIDADAQCKQALKQQLDTGK